MGGFAGKPASPFQKNTCLVGFLLYWREYALAVGPEEGPGIYREEVLPIRGVRQVQCIFDSKCVDGSVSWDVATTWTTTALSLSS